MRALWIQGPAGSGKTRLVSAYGERQAGAVRWFNAGQGDRDPVSLFHGLATLSGACDLPDFAREQPFDLDNFARRFFRAWFQAGPAGTILVLDDWQAIAGSLVEAIVPALIDQIPDGCALIVLSRAAPDPALARHVLNDRLGRLAMDELAFTADEAGELAERLGTVLPAAALSDLIAATEGWAMGVHLLLKSGVRAKGLSQPDEMLRAYVDKELLDPLGSVEREVLLKACLIDVMDDAFVASLIDVPDAHTVLRDLARRDGFLISLSSDGHGFRCPALIRDLLRKSARASLGPPRSPAWRRGPRTHWQTGDARGRPLNSSTAPELQPNCRRSSRHMAALSLRPDARRR
jgi:LuxR family maltose regulon positive regulatory protein